VRGELRLRASTLSGDDQLTFQIVGATSDAGWYLIVARGREHRLIQDPAVQPLSVGCEVLTCTAEEQTICSAAADWRDGRRVWSVSYDGEDAASDTVVHGDLPLSASIIRDEFAVKARAEDAGDALVDPMFEIPIEIVRSVTGYKPGAANPAFAGRFTLLEGLDTPWWKRMIFGG
jgi:hypothetical protein